MKLISADHDQDMVAMCAFQIEKCQIVWAKDASSENDRQSIMKELRGMSNEIQEAVKFTKKLGETRMNEVKFWLNANPEVNYTLSIYYDVHAAAWGMLLEDTINGSPKVVGEIACLDPMTFSFIEKDSIFKTEAFSNP
jgi:hypothetical protein